MNLTAKGHNMVARTLTGLFALFATAAGLLAPMASGADAAQLPVVKPVMACADLLKLDLSYLKDAPYRRQRRAALGWLRALQARRADELRRTARSYGAVRRPTKPQWLEALP